MITTKQEGGEYVGLSEFMAELEKAMDNHYELFGKSEPKYNSKAEEAMKDHFELYN